MTKFIGIDPDVDKSGFSVGIAEEKNLIISGSLSFLF